MTLVSSFLGTECTCMTLKKKLLVARFIKTVKISDICLVTFTNYCVAVISCIINFSLKLCCMLYLLAYFMKDVMRLK